MFDFLRPKKRRAAQARRLELGGDLEGAFEAYLKADLRDDAARLLLLRADCETDATRRMALSAQAMAVGGDLPHGRAARRRRALLGFDLLDAGGARLRGELAEVAAELEAVGEWHKAARAFALAGDEEGELRVLRDAGAIAELEEKLDAEAASSRLERERRAILERLGDLDRLGERRAALREAGRWLEGHPDDDSVRARALEVRSRLLAGPVVDLEIAGVQTRALLGGEVTVGRARADLVVHADGVSRQHLRIFRREDGPWVEDLATRNGTTLAGARLAAPIPVGAGLELLLADQVPVRVAPLLAGDHGGPVAIDAAGERYLAGLGPLPVPPARAEREHAWLLLDAHDGDERFVVLRTPAGQEPPHRDGLRLAAAIELAVGDALSTQRGGTVRLRVPRQGGA